MPQHPMNENILLLSLKDNSLLFLSDAPEGSSFKNLENDKFLVCEGLKKRIIKLNDVFDIYGNLYAFVLKDAPITPLQFENKHAEFFILVNTCFLSFLKNCLHIKITKLFFKILKDILFKKRVILFFTSLFSLSLLYSPTKTRRQEEIHEKSLLATQKSLYATYQFILKNVQDEFDTVLVSSQSDISFRSLTMGTSKKRIDPMVKLRDNKGTSRDKKTPPHDTDPDTEYFLKLKQQK